MTRHWMEAIARLRDSAEPYVLITVIGVQGSTPRESGSKMLVTAGEAFDTIGGGHLEFAAIEHARQLLLAGKNSQALEHFPLGARLGQCCGGRASLLFECFAARGPQVVLFGAGHVGRALAPLLAGLPLRLEWVDSRAAEFPQTVPEGVRMRLLEEPEDAVHEAPPSSYFLVMTHNHPLDYAIAEAVLKRGDAGFLGMIGSRTKARRFQMRLEQHGYPQEVIAQMHCPIGLSEVPGKRPLEVAISVAAQVIARYHQDAPARQMREGVEWAALCSEGSCSDLPENAKT
ncbi:xanthine dehydrogenase accessory protein XdhC [Pseudomonas sp. PDM22]|uniref:xanthine dehydrogenase accessory protein XdhC n=1 Tax=Pseudomonas sp. PDM22 TaxID=2769287 RepID=UPI0009DA8ED8|nr:xanthine dehydrogenase accessory protein XdhC [Pseudomonas sp. PDM22]MBD9514812.1 xanthine dehydrogenase accessory protein XdhC [Pseudomonas sp. PDM22]OQR32027.1 xanthine dehydrogenase accessory protein XdhC [Pseudomonas sp. T]